jgi:hypothetical protein
LIYWAIARCTEITWAFISDAVRVLKRERPTTDLGSSERVVMAIRSYFGLLLNFALLYYCLNDQVAGLRFAGFADAFYFSGSVLAGLDLRPEPDLVLAKYLVLWQWLIGTFMIVIAVAGYLDNRTQPGGEVVPSSEESTRMPAFDSSPAEAYFFLHAFLVTLAVCYPLH